MTELATPEAPSKPSGPLPRYLAGFRRITTSGNYIPEIDGLRFIAIAAVVMHHVAIYVCSLDNRPEGWFDLGKRGVELFFAISGFILAVPFAAHYLAGAPRVRLGQYFLRRITRLEPPYLLALLLLFVIKIFTSEKDLLPLLFGLAASAAYLHTTMFGTLSAVMGPSWSLEIEVQFYLLMPLLALVFLIRNRWLRRGIICAAMLAVVIVQPITLRPMLQGVKWQRHEAIVVMDVVINTAEWDRHIGNYLQFFLAGVLLADIFVVNWNRAPSRSRWGDLAWLAGWPLLVWTLASLDHLIARLAFPLLVLMLYIALFRSVLARRLMALPIIATIGGMCYSIYLLHNGIIQVAGIPLRRLFMGYGFAAQIVIASLLLIPLILTLCALYFRLIERPCMRRDWPKRVSNMIFPESERSIASAPTQTAPNNSSEK
jgi:peptidoglycan/LPS O-acetylase OafA/YrhL